MTVRRLLACAIALLATNSAAATPSPCTDSDLSEEIRKACRDYRLKSAEQALQDMYDRAAEVSRRPIKLAADQAAWATQTLRRCPAVDCMSAAYRQRTAALRLAHFDALRINDKPLTAQDTAQICRSVAALASEKRLARLRLPTGEDWHETLSPAVGWSLTAEEQQVLEHAQHWPYGKPFDLYRIKLTASGRAARYGTFATGGTCRADRVANVDRMLARLRSGKDIENEIDDDQSGRWEYLGSGDYPIVLNGRNLLITAGFGDGNQPSTVSWLKPDGGVETVCTMSANAVYSKVVESHDDAVCHGVASGRIPALPTWRVDANLALDRSQPDSRAQYETRYGGYADEVVLLPHNPSGNGSGERWAVFTYHSGAGCGARWQWLRLLTPDLGTATSHALNSLNAAAYRNWETVNVYEYGQARYVERLDSEGNGELLRSAQDGRVEQVCRFERHHEFR